jgi:transposase
MNGPMKVFSGLCANDVALIAGIKPVFMGKQQLIGIEACGGFHFLGQTLQGDGDDVQLMPAQSMSAT